METASHVGLWSRNLQAPNPSKSRRSPGSPRPRRLRGAHRVPGIPVGWHLAPGGGGSSTPASPGLHPLAGDMLEMSRCHHEAISDPWPICSLVPLPEYHLPVCHPCLSGGEGGVLAGPSPSNSTPGMWVHTKDPSPAPLRQQQELHTHQRPPHPQGPVPQGGRGGAGGSRACLGSSVGCACVSASLLPPEEVGAELIAIN